MRKPYQHRISRAVSLTALVATAIAAIACSEATAPVIPKKYIVTTSKSTAAAGDTLIVKAQLADLNDRSVARSGKFVAWYVLNANGQFTSSVSPTDANGIATNYFVVGPAANVSDVIFVSDDDQLQGHSPPISVVPAEPAVYIVTTSSSQPAIGSTVSVSAQMTDKYGNRTPVAGRVVTWSFASNSGYYYQVGVSANRLVVPTHALRTESASFDSPTSTTNNQGVATVNFNVGTTFSSSYVISADDGRGASGRSQPITVQPGPVAKFAVTVSVSNPPAGATVVVTANASDAYGNSISTPGTQVQWSVTGAGGSLSSTASAIGQTGVATTRLITGSTPGTSYTVTASAPQSTATGTSPTITTIEQVALVSMATGLGPQSSCGIATDSKLWCWGAEGGFLPRTVPGKPIGEQTVSAISASSQHTCAISAGTVICWGFNGAGQLGDNTDAPHSTPAPINSSLSFTAVSTGSDHTCALATTFEIYCWGNPGDGRLGDGTSASGRTPVRVAGSVSFTAVSAGRAHNCAIATSGDAYCWGANDRGQLGNGSFSPSATPSLVAGGLKFTAISAGDSHTCGITASGVYCWGDNTFGQLGSSSGVLQTASPMATKTSSTFVTIAAGGFNTCAIASDGKAFCWGDNRTGELGNPEFVQSQVGVPVPAGGGLTFKSIAVGGSGDSGTYYGYSYGPSAQGHACAVTTDGVTYCWGNNSTGELGTSAIVPSSATPLKVDGQH